MAQAAQENVGIDAPDRHRTKGYYRNGEMSKKSSQDKGVLKREKSVKKFLEFFMVGNIAPSPPPLDGLDQSLLIKAVS